MVRNVKSKGNYEYTRAYTDISGVMLGGSGTRVPESLLAYSENMYRDYEGEGNGVIESVPGYRRVADFGERIGALKLQKGASEDYIVLRAGNKLYRVPFSERDDYTVGEPLITLKKGDGTMFTYGSTLYICDGDRMLSVTDKGEVSEVSDDDAYIPITYLNGERFEDRNVLTSLTKEEFIMPDPTNYIYGHPAFRYIVTDTINMTCKLTGTDYSPTGRVTIPTTTVINGKRYRVTEVDTKALWSCTDITELYIAEGVEVIRGSAFKYCKGLTKVVMPRTVVKIESSAFAECSNIKDFYLGSGTREVGSNLFIGPSVDLTLHYGGNEDQYSEISGKEVFSDFDIVYEDEDRTAQLELFLTGSVTDVSSVTINDAEAEFIAVNDGDYIKSVIVVVDGAWEKPSDVIVKVSVEDYKSTFGYNDIEAISAREAIYDMTVAEMFDGRVFLSGNPKIPNTIFYSARTRSGIENPLYFGTVSYMNDGVGRYSVKSMLAVRDSLAVFKDGDDGTGSIFYHSPHETGDPFLPKIYPVQYIHSGIVADGGSISFFDDPVFLTRAGLYGLDQKAINYERSVSARSHNVNYDLLKRDISGASLTEWQGYLVVGVGDTAYLADSRSRFRHSAGSTEYDWFVLSGLGGWKNSTRVYRYDSYAPEGYKVGSAGEVADGTIYSVELDGNMIWYTEKDGERYTVYPTEEMRGGDFYPATVYLGDGNLLFFGDESGALFVFNNDKRGVPPKRLSSMADFDAEEYHARMGRDIHPDFYAFDNHAPRYAIKTSFDNCDIPHLTKSTIKHSLVIKCKAYTKSELLVVVGTDKGSYTEVARFPSLELSFGELCFEAMCFSPLEYSNVPVAEKEKNWVEKQITIFSEAYASPIGIYSIAYRYTVKGRIKKE